MEHEPRKPRRDAEQSSDLQPGHPIAETGKAAEGLGEIEAPVAQQPEIADRSPDANQSFAPPPPVAISAGEFEGVVDDALQSESRDSSARVVDGIGVDVSDLTASDFVGTAFDDLPGADSFTVNSGFLPRAMPGAPPTIGDLLARPGDPVFIQQLPDRRHSASDHPQIQLLGDSNEAVNAGGASSSGSDLNSRTKALLSPTSDGGPPLARPIVQVSLSDAKLMKVRDEALEAASKRDAKTCKDVAEEVVDYYDWRRNCELRALNGDY